MHVVAKPVVKCSLNPRRLFTKKLVGDEDELILCDGLTSMGDASCFTQDRFDAGDFPWHIVLDLLASLAMKES